MSLPRRKRRRMYAVSAKSVGVIEGTMAYSRRGSIKHFLDGHFEDWEMFKRNGYRTVEARVDIVTPSPTR